MAEPLLSGRSAIVTGASQGLGLEIARGLLAASADVAICARTATDLVAAEAELRRDFPDRRILAVTCDIARRAGVDHLFEAAFDALGNVDIVVSNAGVHGPIGPIEEVDWDAWLGAVAVNLAGTAYCCREAVRRFKARKRITNHAKIIVLSGGGATSPQPGLTAYGASKAGLVRFTEALAGEVREFGIDVNSIAPGALATRMLSELRDAGPSTIGAAYHSRVETILADGGTPMTKASELCVYLASSASDGLTGRLISAVWDPWPFDEAKLRDIVGGDIYTLRRITPQDRNRDWGDR